MITIEQLEAMIELLHLRGKRRSEELDMDWVKFMTVTAEGKAITRAVAACYALQEAIVVVNTTGPQD